MWGGPPWSAAGPLARQRGPGQTLRQPPKLPGQTD
jgi:hypothetical protein